MTEVCLGIDPNVKRLGLALVAFEPPHEVLWADTFSIDRVDGGWTHEQVGAALRRVQVAEDVHTDEGDWIARIGPDLNITRIGIELPPYVNNRQVFRQLSIVFGLVGAECHRRWPWAPQVSCDVGQWKQGVLGKGKGNASKAEVMDWALDRMIAGPGCPIVVEQDSADAVAIATYAAGVELVERGAA